MGAYRRAAILGGAACVWDDFRRLQALAGGPWTGPIVCINDVGVHWPWEFDAWVTLHPEMLVRWTWERQKAGHPGGYRTYSNRLPEPDPVTGIVPSYVVDEVVGHWGGGSAGLYAVRVCAHRAWAPILCGCPLDDQEPFEESTEDHSVPANLRDFRRAWVRHLGRDREPGHFIRTHARSMSGWTREVLGEPDPATLTLAVPRG